MKKLLFAVCVLCALLLCSAWADQTISTDHFELDIPDGSTKIGSYYATPDKAVIQLEELAATGFSEYYLDLKYDVVLENFLKGLLMGREDMDYQQESIVAAGKQSTLFYFIDDYGNDEYYTFSWAEESLCLFGYGEKCNPNSKQRFLSMLAGFRQKGTQPPANASTITRNKTASGRSVTVPQGTWIVGKDIPANQYSIQYPDHDGGALSLTVWREKEGDYSNDGLVCACVVSEKSPMGRITLESGYIVVIKNSPAIFSSPMSLGF